MLVEELGALPQTVREDIANLLRAIFTNRFNGSYLSLGRLMVIIAGSIELYKLAAVQVSPLNNMCETIYLSDLSETDSVGLIADGLTYVGMSPDQATAAGQAVYTSTIRYNLSFGCVPIGERTNHR